MGRPNKLMKKRLLFCKNKIIEIKVNVPGDNFVVKKQCKTFEEAMDLSVNPIERFLKKYKETR